MTQLPLDILAQDAIAALSKNHAQCSDRSGCGQLTVRAIAYFVRYSCRQVC
ncbi:hypothetical protein [Coleofasciculus sp. H7-2]|uniref:hypothetical protein n=1 Tax=Coleofasciculus sp. H7-2 TaxID=3351545 RepID=UPI003670C7AF